MTSKARVVLQDVKHAISNHSDDLQSEAFRVSWLSIVSLLRAVGHVLDKVDGKTSLIMRTTIDDKWKELQKTQPEPVIFWGFIKCERDRFLKNYEHSISRTLSVQGPDIDSKATSIVIDCANSRGGRMSSSDAIFESFISDGPYAGRHEREVALEAYEWWLRYLDEIDSCVEVYAST